MKTPGGKGNKTEISNLPDKEFKTLVMLTELGKRLDEHSENFNKELENIFFKKLSEMKKKITEMKTQQKELIADQVIQKNT